jgi:hypothetical protein
LELLTRKKFSYIIENTVQRESITYIEAIIDYCDEYEIPYESAKDLITKALKDKIEADASNFNYLERVSKLPI